MKRFMTIAIVLFVFFTLMFLLAEHMGWLNEALVREKMTVLRDQPGGWWLLFGGIVLLLATDLLLPIPSSIIMTLSGSLLGFWAGGLASFFGAMLSAFFGFYACRLGRERLFKRLVGEQDLERIGVWFEQRGVFAIIISRAVPMLTEILSCLAGLSAMRSRAFFLASLLGTLPVCLVYSFFGHLGTPENPWPALCAAFLLPIPAWLFARRLHRFPEGEES